MSSNGLDRINKLYGDHGNRQVVTMRQAAYEVLTLTFFYRFVTTREALSDATTNLAVVSALMLTMVSIAASGNTGDELPGVSEELTATTYTILAFISLCAFFLATLVSAVTLVFAAFMQSDAALRVWVAQCGYMIKIKLVTFGLGLLVYITMTLWQLASLVGVSLAITASLPGFAGLFWVLYGVVHSVATLANANEPDGHESSAAGDAKELM